MPGSGCRPSGMSSSRGAVERSEGDHHDAWPWILESARVAWRVRSSSFGVSTERNELVERGRREVGG